ncbi:MAG: hypothetical protein ACI9BW_002864 [Gammaproteobacteria bacterium]|jgi:hypothetical protein
MQVHDLRIYTIARQLFEIDLRAHGNKTTHPPDKQLNGNIYLPIAGLTQEVLPRRAALQNRPAAQHSQVLGATLSRLHTASRRYSRVRCHNR